MADKDVNKDDPRTQNTRNRAKQTGKPNQSQEKEKENMSPHKIKEKGAQSDPKSQQKAKEKSDLDKILEPEKTNLLTHSNVQPLGSRKACSFSGDGHSTR